MQICSCGKYIYYPIKVRETASSDEYENAYATMTDVLKV